MYSCVVVVVVIVFFPWGWGGVLATFFTSRESMAIRVVRLSRSILVEEASMSIVFHLSCMTGSPPHGGGKGMTGRREGRFAEARCILPFPTIQQRWRRRGGTPADAVTRFFFLLLARAGMMWRRRVPHGGPGMTDVFYTV